MQLIQLKAMRLPSVLTQIRSKVRVLFISRAIIRLEANSKCFLTFLNGLINVYISGSIMINVITLHETHNYDCRTLPFSLHFTSLIRVKLQLSKPLSSLPTQFSKTIYGPSRLSHHGDLRSSQCSKPQKLYRPPNE